MDEFAVRVPVEVLEEAELTLCVVVLEADSRQVLELEQPRLDQLAL